MGWGAVIRRLLSIGLVSLLGAAQAHAAPDPLIAGLSDDGRLLLLGNADGTLSIRSIDSKAEVAATATALRRWRGIAASPDGKRLAALGDDGEGRLRLLLWEAGASLPRAYDAPFRALSQAGVGTPQFAPDGRSLLVRPDNRGPGYLIDFASGRVLGTVGDYGEAAFAPSGKTLITKSADEKGFTLYDAADGRAIATRDLDSLNFEVMFRRDERIAVIGYDCGITLFDPSDVSGSTPVTAAADESGCTPDRLSPDATMLSVEIDGGANGPGRYQIRDLQTGAIIVDKPADKAFDGATISGGRLLRERSERIFLSLPPDGPETALPLSTAYFLNNYRSRTLSGSRLLSAFPDEPVMVFDITSGARLTCIEKGPGCAAQALRSAYAMAVRDGAPEQVIAALRGGDASRALLGPLWEQSRLELAQAHMALGNRPGARAAYEEAIAGDQPEVRAEARLGLARILLEQRELGRALALAEAAIAGLETDGALPSATKAVLVRKSNGLRIELSAVDMPALAGFLDEIRSRSGVADPPLLDAADYSRLIELQELGTASREYGAMGLNSAGSVAWSYARKKLFVRLGDAEALRAEIMLAQSRGDADAARAATAQAALERFTLAYDGERSLLSTEIRARRQTLRADALERMGALDPALGARVAALDILRQETIARPLALAEAWRRLATTQMLRMSWPEARSSLEKARDLLAGAVPANDLTLLEVRGAIGLLLARHESEAGQGLGAIEPAIVLARRRIAVSAGPTASEQALRLKTLFGAGVEAQWLASMPAAPEVESLTAARPGTPLDIGFDSAGFALALRFSRDGSRLASDEFRRTVIWDSDSGKGLAVQPLSGKASFFDTGKPLDFPGRRGSARFDPDGLTIEARDGKPPVRIGFGGVVSVGAVSPDGKRVALGGAFAPIIRVYDSSTGAMISQLDGHNDKILSLAWHPDSMRLASSSKSGAILIFDVESRLVTARMGEEKGVDAHRSEVSDIAFSQDSRFLFSAAKEIGSGSRAVRQWDVRTRRAVNQFDADSPDRLLVAPDASRFMALGYSDVAIYEVARPDEPKLIEEAISGLADVALAEGPTAIVLGYSFAGTRALSLNDGATLWSNAGAKGQSIAVSPDGKLIALANPNDDEEAITILDARNGDRICGVDVEGGFYSGEGDLARFAYDKLAFTADGASLAGIGRKLAITSEEQAFAGLITHSARWNARSCAGEAELVGDAARQDSATQSLVFGGDAFALASGLGGADDPVVTVGFASDGKHGFALTKAHRLWLAWPGGTRPAIELARFAPKLGKLLFSPDGKRLVATSESNIWMWDAETGAFIGRFGG